MLRIRSFYYRYALTLTTIYSHLLVALLAGSLVLTVYIFYQWSTLLILLVLYILAALVTARLLFGNEPTKRAPGRAYTSRTVLPRPVQSELPLSLNFPQTPMPSTPLIRVLETIDLSTSGVEHFISAPPTTQLPEELTVEQTPMAKALLSQEQES